MSVSLNTKTLIILQIYIKIYITRNKKISLSCYFIIRQKKEFVKKKIKKGGKKMKKLYLSQWDYNKSLIFEELKKMVLNNGGLMVSDWQKKQEKTDIKKTNMFDVGL